MPLIVACVQAGNYCGRGAEYVNILYDMVTRNLPEGYRGVFRCFTDNPAGLHSNIDARPLPAPGLKGWWNKLALFKDGVFGADDRVVYLDLDTLITGRLDEIVSYDGEFAIMDDLFRPTEDSIFGGWQSGVMAWRGGFGAHIWDRFVAAGYPDVPGGDQAWIRQCQPSADLLQSLYPGRIVSYKANAGAIHPTASIVCFHGHPRPHEVLTGWVPMVWKIDGISRADLDVICNTEQAVIHDHVRAAMARNGAEPLTGNPDHYRHVCIVGSGPSLGDPETLDELKFMIGAGHAVWALNGAHDWLIDHGIVPDAMVLTDSRPDNAAFLRRPHKAVTYYLASQCHPSTFDALARHKVVLFHNNTPGVADLLETLTTAELPILSGGTTVAMKALVIARVRGFKTFHLYGIDSCYRGAENHAFPQPVHNEERVLDTFLGEDHRHFRCAPWMVTQAQDFQKLAAELAEDDCIVHVAGDGMLAAIARLMMQEAPQEPAGSFREQGGFLWPAWDRDGSSAILAGAKRDIERVLRVARRRRVAVQAGGNVGVYAVALADHFRRVVTVEPDAENFECLLRNAGRVNIKAVHAALGDGTRPMALVRHEANCGAHRVSGEGEVPQITIDGLALDACDLIWLDVEGYELPALKGAVRTIAKHRPVIVVEDKGLSDHYGIPQGAVLDWLADRGYAVADRFGRDIVLLPEDQMAVAA